MPARSFLATALRWIYKTVVDPNRNSISRRRFLKRTALGAGGVAWPRTSLGLLAADDSGAAVRSAVSNQKAYELFEPIHYRPMPARVTGLEKSAVLLDGAWRIDPKPGASVRRAPLNAANWGNFEVPGQWAQQGYDIPQDQTVALAKEFRAPASWAGHRIFLRFDAIHGGTRYWLNGHPLGYSENLFTPVEWEITEAVKFGQASRLDLEMKVDTTSERLSHSCYYTGYTLGGIDRAVRIYPLPGLHVSRLRLNAGLDENYRDGELQILLGLDRPEQIAGDGVAVTLRLFDARGKQIQHSNSRVALEPLQRGLNRVSIESSVSSPRKWNAEQPNLYKLLLALEKDGQILERIERHIGFRKIEIKERRLYVNGARVKLAGACHHEIDPLTGRANTQRHAKEDLKLFKRANLNFARTSHYPPTREFLDAADRYGFYVELEAPFCWAQPKGPADLKAILTATSAMIDYNHAHPSVMLWSLANESSWSKAFEESNKLCKRLDPTRPTTFDGGQQRACDILSLHYQKMPYDEVAKDDPRPFLHGECFFEIYHERTDVAINPGLRELWAAGSADPNSDLGKSCIENVRSAGPGLLPGIYPGAWSYICGSEHCIGSDIWAGVDDIAFLRDGKVVSSEHGNAYWGLVDGWRRPKPEWWLSRFVFSPVWFPIRRLDWQPGQSSVRVPVENRHSFTNLSRFDFVWELDGANGKARIRVPPTARGEIEIPIPKEIGEGTTLLLRVLDGSREIVNATLTVGRQPSRLLPQPRAGAPRWNDDGRSITIEGEGFSLVLGRATGDFVAANPKHHAPILAFPSLHVTRHDFGDLSPGKPPYAEFPDARTRVVESVSVSEIDEGLELTVKDHYQGFAGAVRWLLDKDGLGRISYDYGYTGEPLDSREVGIKALLLRQCDRLQWRRWSEWGVFPDESISRTVGVARARRDKKWPEQPANVKPAWAWSQDQTSLGTADFRSIKFRIYEASLAAPDGAGARVEANADAHFRACLGDRGVKMHVLSQCALAPVVIRNGGWLVGSFSVRLVTKG